jgi:predicted Zn-dependent protease
MDAKKKILALVTPAFVILVGLALAPAYAFRSGDHVSERRDREHDLRRIRGIMMPLLRATDHPERLSDISVKIVADPSINAGSAGGGQFLITTGLLDKANEGQLRGVLAHEIAHDDLGHPAKLQLLGVSLSLGAALLEKVLPGSATFAPLAGTVIAATYSRPQEWEADRHAVAILQRAGYSKSVMINTLSWIMQVEGNSGGGFLSTHPATNERIQALRRL